VSEPGQGQRAASTAAFPAIGPLGPRAAGAAAHPHSAQATRLRGDNRGFILRRLLAVSDLVGLILSWVIVQALLLPTVGRAFSVGAQLTFVLMLPLWTYVGSLLGIYHSPDRRLDHSIAEDFGPVALTATVWSWGFILTRAAFENGSIEVLPSVALWGTSIVAIVALRSFVRGATKRRAWYKQRVFLIGAPHDVRRITRRIKRHPEYGLVVVRILSLDEGGSAPGGAPGTDDGDGSPVPEAEVLTEIVALSGINRVIIATPPTDSEARSELVRRLKETDVHIDIMVGDPEVFSSNSVIHHVEGLPLFTIPAVDEGRAWAALKRSLDVVSSAAGLLAIAPLFAYCALRIKLGSKGPVFFRQQRIGRYGEPFELIKLRTMVTEADTQKGEVTDLNVHLGTDTPGMFKIHADPRVTPFGRTLRRYSLDELPQLWNVLKGDMSLVGPRPLIPEEASLIDGDYGERTRMRPGITGPWQALGRSDIGFADMIKLDYTYVANWSFAEDLRLLLRTIGAVLRGRGAY
jgi:exopolysaccharide biosynthesis polyprenyl glycosylphosphotransferase